VIHKIQSIAAESQLSIPLIYSIDSPHGASYVLGATIFPHQIGIAATFDSKFASAIGAVTSKDTRAAGMA